MRIPHPFIPLRAETVGLSHHIHVIDRDYTIGPDGMITSINGIENPADFSSCWMLYTSDVENSNTAWGTVEYQGVKYGSAISGAETLKIKPDQLYIWVFQSFS